jgi:hypothetical protein
VPSLVEAALAHGCDAAEKLLIHTGYLNADELCQYFKIGLRDMPLVLLGKSVRGMYANEPPTIYINPAAISELVQLIDIDENKARDTVIFHEIYHYLERHGLGITWKMLEPIWKKDFLGRKKLTPIVTTCEIAAHSFAQKCGRMSFYPGEFDFVEDFAMLQTEYISIKMAIKKEG